LFDDDFSRFAVSRGLVLGSPQYSQQRTIAMCIELEPEYFSSSQPKLENFQALCSEVGVPPGRSIAECRARLKGVYVNIVDLINARRMGTRVRVFNSFAEFRNYTRQPGKTINREVAKAGFGSLASLLHYLD
jgi:hypothetical protein